MLLLWYKVIRIRLAARRTRQKSVELFRLLGVGVEGVGVDGSAGAGGGRVI